MLDAGGAVLAGMASPAGESATDIVSATLRWFLDRDERETIAKY